MATKDKSWKELSSKGGKTTLERHGRQHYVKLAEKTNETILKTKGSEYYKNLSRMGVEARRKKREKKMEGGDK